MQYVVRVSPDFPKGWSGYAKGFYETAEGVRKTFMLVGEIESAVQLDREEAVALAGEFMEEIWATTVAVVSVQDAWEEEQAEKLAVLS